ncbi:MAG: hypothetical protein AAFV33_18915 [Chloroflexota bacterium]
MDIIEVLLVITVVSSSLFVGIIAAMMGVIQRMLYQLDYATYTQVMQGIITSGRKAIVVWVLLLLPLLSAGIALVLLRDSIGTPTFIGAAVGVVLFVAGPVLVSRYANEPWYDRIMAWDKDTEVEGWREERMHWFHLNLLRFSIGCAGCGALAMALALY